MTDEGHLFPIRCSEEAILFGAGAEPLIRRATERDLPAVVALFGDPDGNARDRGKDASDPAYRAALAAMIDDNLLMVAEVEGRVVGVFQLTILQHVAHLGGRVAQVETVFVDRAMRGRGIGEAMMRWAIDEARRRRCFRVQLTSNKRRTRAHAFYERLGFVASHQGMKLLLE
jgi:GNAT superfamily N-acetyltransferase